MRSRILPIVGVAAVALVAGAAFAGQASASTHPGLSHKGSVGAAHVAKAGGCGFSNTADDTGDAVLSQNFTDSGFDVYNSAGAADFSSSGCTIKKVNASGQYFNGSGPADSVSVIVYKNKKGAPGKIVAEKDGLKYTGSGSLSTKAKIKLKKGNYWLSFVATMAYSSGGEWGWEVSSDQPGSPDLWQNPGGGFGICPSWDTVLDCIGVQGDYMGSW